MSDHVRARADGTGLSSDDQAASRLDPSGFDPSRDESDMSWFLIAVSQRKASGYRDVVILDYSAGWSQFDIEFYWEDTFETDAPTHLEAGAYRWSGFTVGFWGESDHLNVTGGTFVRDSDGSPEGGDACGSVHDSAGALAHRPPDGTGEPQ